MCEGKKQKTIIVNAHTSTVLWFSVVLSQRVSVCTMISQQTTASMEENSPALNKRQKHTSRPMRAANNTDVVNRGERMWTERKEMKSTPGAGCVCACVCVASNVLIWSYVQINRMNWLLRVCGLRLKGGAGSLVLVPLRTIKKENM